MRIPHVPSPATAQRRMRNRAIVAEVRAIAAEWVTDSAPLEIRAVAERLARRVVACRFGVQLATVDRVVQQAALGVGDCDRAERPLPLSRKLMRAVP